MTYPFKFVAVIIFILGCNYSLNAQNNKDYVVKVHEGTELLHVINYLAKVYVPAEKNSTYVKEVDAWFKQFINHPAVDMAKKLPYNDFSDLGWCIRFPSLEVIYPKKYGYFDQIVDKNILQNYLKLAADFAQDSNFIGFYKSQQQNYTLWENQFKEALNQEKPLEILADFYQFDLNETLFFSISPMGVVLRANIYQNEISPENSDVAPVIIPFDTRFTTTKTLEPNFNFEASKLKNNVWHEVSHIYWERINSNYREELLALTYEDELSKNFKTFKDPSQNRYFFIHEVVADAVTIFLKQEYIGLKEAQAHLNINESYGSPLYRKLVDLIAADYWETRTQLPFKAFVPQIISVIAN